MGGRSDFYPALWCYPFGNAPSKLREFLPSGHVGLWIVSVPRDLDGPDLGWIRSMGPKVTRHPLEADVLYVVSRPE